MQMKCFRNSSREEAAQVRRRFAGAVVALLAAALAACSDESTAEKQQSAPAAEQSLISARNVEWLKLTDDIAPEQWLASREAARDLDIYDPAVIDMRHVLEAATSRFRDQPRMIANRAVQLEAMLSERAIAERAPYLIVSLSQVPGGQRSVESFAALTQQYFNLRLEGLTRAAALDALRQRAIANR